MLSFSNFGSNRSAPATKVARAVQILHRDAPELHVDGEMQVGPALDVEQQDRLFEFCRIDGEANVLVPNSTVPILGTSYEAPRRNNLVGPILIGMNSG